MSSEFFNVERKSGAAASALPEWINARGDAPAGTERKAGRGTSRFMLIGLVLVAALGIATAVPFIPEESGMITLDPAPPMVPLEDWSEGLVDPSKEQGGLPQSLPTLDVPREPTGPLSIGDVIKRVEHGVVLINTSDQSGESRGFGSGFVVDSKGWIATNYHVLSGAAKATVKLRDGETRDVRGLVAWSENGDMAILQIADPPQGLKPLELGTSDPPASGESVVAIGHPQGFNFSATAGNISAVRKTSELPKEMAALLSAPENQVWVQHTAAIAGGSSGGPLFDSCGRVIGMNTVVARENFAFAVHISELAALLAKPAKDPTKDLEPLPALRSVRDLENPLADLDPRVRTMLVDYQRALQQWQSDWFQARTPREREQIKARDPRAKYAARFWQVADSSRKTLAGIQALTMACQLYEEGDDDRYLKRALARLLEDHLDNRGLHHVFNAVYRSQHDAVDAFLANVIEKSPHHQVQGYACFIRANLLGNRNKPEHHATVFQLLDRCSKEFKDLKLDDGSDLAAAAEEYRIKVKHLSVGAEAQEIDGKDAQGKPMKLSDFRGKVVMLDFFADWCPHCVVMYPHERELVKRYKDKPFALLGVNGDSADTMDQLIAEGKVTWRCWPDGRSGVIARKWHITGFPTIFLIDARGVIRETYSGRPEQKQLDAALEKLIQEALAYRPPLAAPAR
jgi:S1-C subfamily serine protease/peroxiredoxin